jgi:hypothetical protein
VPAPLNGGVPTERPAGVGQCKKRLGIFRFLDLNNTKISQISKLSTEIIVNCRKKRMNLKFKFGFSFETLF